MEKKILAIFSIVVAVLAAVSMTGTLVNAQSNTVGAVFTIDNSANGNNVWSFNRMSDGSLKLEGNFSTKGNGTGANLGSQGAVTLSQDGKWLVVVDAGSNEITLFMVNGSSLTFADKQSSHGMTPISVTVNGSWVYVLNNGTASTPPNIAGFKINQTSGNMTYIAGSNQSLSGAVGSSPEQIGFNPNGTVLVVTEKAANMTDVFTVNSNGTASTAMNMTSLSPGPYGFAFTNSSVLVLSEAVLGTVSSFAVSSNGTMRILSGSIPSFSTAPCWVVVTGNGQYAYIGNGGGTISSYMISNNGMLTLQSSIAAKLDKPTLDLALSNDSSYLYSLNGNFSITGFKVYQDGSIWQIGKISGLPPSATGLAAT